MRIKGIRSRTSIALFCCLLLSVIYLTASPQHPYVHELFGPDLRISWPEGQKAHEDVMELFYVGKYIPALQKLERAISDVEQFSKTKEKDAAILLTTKAQWLSLTGDTQASDTAFLRAQSLAEPVLGTNHPVTARIQLIRAEVLLLRGDLPEAKAALERAIAAQAGHYGTNDVAFAMSLRLQAIVHLTEGDTGQARAHKPKFPNH